jgi:hypothetical protein
MDADFAKTLRELRKQAAEANLHFLSYILGMAELELKSNRKKKRGWLPAPGTRPSGLA